MDTAQLSEFATRYTAAWCSQDPTRVAAFFAEDGSLTINAGAPSVGRAAIAAAARGFMDAFPDLVVRMDGTSLDGPRAVYRWSLTGTNTGPGGTGRAVRISGYEEWTFGADGLVAESKGHFDEADYRRQLGGERATSDAKRTVEAYMEAYRSLDHARILACLTDDVEWLIPGAFHARGKPAFDKEIENDEFLGAPEIDVARLVEEGEVVVAEGAVRGRRKDGAVWTLAFCDVFEMRGNQIRRLTSYLARTA